MDDFEWAAIAYRAMLRQVLAAVAAEYTRRTKDLLP